MKPSIGPDLSEIAKSQFWLAEENICVGPHVLEGDSGEKKTCHLRKGPGEMTRYRLHFAADGMHEEETREFEEPDGSFVFWLAETEDGREFEVTADAKPLCRVKRSCANKDFWVIGRPSRTPRL